MAAAGFFAALAAFLAAGFLTAVFFAAGFLAALVFFAAAFLAAGFVTVLAAFLAAGLAAAFLATGFFSAAFLGAGAFFSAGGAASGASSGSESCVERAWLRHARSVCARRAAVASERSGHASWMRAVSAAFVGAVSSRRSGASCCTTSFTLIAALRASRSSLVPRVVATSAAPLSEIERASPAARKPRLFAAWMA